MTSGTEKSLPVALHTGGIEEDSKVRPENIPIAKPGSVWEARTVCRGDGVDLGYTIVRRTSSLGRVRTGGGTDEVHPPGRGDVATDPSTLR